MNEELLNKFSKLNEIYPSKCFSELCLQIVDNVIETLSTQKISDEELIKALDFCINVPQFLDYELWCNEKGEYFVFENCENGEFKEYKIYKDDFYDFRYKMNKRGKRIYKFIPVWEEYKSFEDIIRKCEKYGDK